MTSAVGFPPETVYEITNITKAFPCVVTLAEVTRDDAFSVADDQTIVIRNVTGMPQINGMSFIIKSLDTDAKTFSLYDLFEHPFDSSGFTTYISGGQIDIVSYPGTPPGLMYNNQTS